MIEGGSATDASKLPPVDYNTKMLVFVAGAAFNFGHERPVTVIELVEVIGRLAGRVVPVLVDGVSRKDPREASGRTRCNRVVNFDAQGRGLLGTVVPVQITEALPHSLRGALAEPVGAAP